MKKILKDILKQIGIIIIYFALNIVVSNVFLKNTNPDNSLESNLLYILSELIVLTSFIIIFRKKLIPDYYDFKKNYKKYLKKYLSYWLIGLVIMVISNNIIATFISLPTNEEQVRLIFSYMPIYYFFMAVIAAPITEELLTRSILKDTFKNPYIFYIISALLFAFLHLVIAKSIYELFYLIPYGTLGFAFAKMHYESNNIWTDIFFHSLHNLIATIIIFLISLGAII